MRLFLLAVAWLALGTRAAAAQTLPPAPATSVLPPVSTDTTAAIHRFYAAKRHLRTRVLLATGGIFLASIAIGNMVGPERYGTYDGSAIRLVTLAFFTVPAVSGELLYFGSYSRRHERFASEDFRAHKLSPSLRERLVPQYFQPATASRPPGGH